MLYVKQLLKSLKDNLSLVVAILCVAYITFLHFNPQEPKVVEKIVEKPIIQETVYKEVVTDIKIKEKTHSSDADIVVENTEDIKVSLNGKTFSLKPSKSDEKFDFSKDYVELRQNSQYNINISNEPLEPSWGIGVGVTDNKNLAGILTMRLRSTPTHVWIMSDGDTTAGGILFSTNYK